MDSIGNEWLGFDYEGTKGERADIAVTVWLRQMPEFAEVSRARVQALIEDGGVLCDGKHIPRGQRNLQPGMHINVHVAALRELLNPPAPEHIEPLDIPLQFLHSDEHIAVVVKPAGLTVHPAPTETGPTLTAALVHHLGQLSDAGGSDRPGIVHRLDKETSGVMVVARSNTAHVSLSRQFADRITEKEYQALVIDPPPQPGGIIDLPIERHPRSRQKMWTGGKRGRSAHTEFRTTEHWGPLTLLDVVIHTGRTHQIRVHLQSIGCAIVNDEKYGAGRVGSFLRFLETGIERGSMRAWTHAWPEQEQRRELHALLSAYPGFFLHARRLSFIHPSSGQRMQFEAELPAEWQQLKELCPRD
ncbi:RluA family pseudouridine synthase [bacterium]|nr:RluA family pseudouridine synthase [bacterium]